MHFVAFAVEDRFDGRRYAIAVIQHENGTIGLIQRDVPVAIHAACGHFKARGKFFRGNRRRNRLQLRAVTVRERFFNSTAANMRNNIPNRPQGGDLCLVHFLHARDTFLQCGENFDALDGVDAEVCFQGH